MRHHSGTCERGYIQSNLPSFSALREPNLERRMPAHQFGLLHKDAFEPQHGFFLRGCFLLHLGRTVLVLWKVLVKEICRHLN